MANSDWLFNFNLLARWLHVIAAIVWIGHLYFFNFVNAQVQPKLDGPTKKLVNPLLMPRALFWFRWGAMITFVMGWTLFTSHYWYTPGKGYGANAQFIWSGHVTERAWWILIGSTLASVMWFNVWFVIWPAQQKIIPAVRDGAVVDAALVKRAALYSKINTHLSAPMLFCMLAAPHYSSINVTTALVATAIGELAIWWAYKASATAGASI